MTRIPPLERANPGIDYTGFLILGVKVYSAETRDDYLDNSLLSLFPTSNPVFIYMFYGSPKKNSFRNKVPETRCKLYYFLSTKIIKVGFWDISKTSKMGWVATKTDIETPYSRTLKSIAVKYMRKILMNIGGIPRA